MSNDSPLPLNLTVEGWRGINHSFAMVNQFQLLELGKTPGIRLFHSDQAYFFPHWNKDTNAAGFHAADEAYLAALPAPEGIAPDWTYRIFSPIDLRPGRQGERLAVFVVTELGLDNATFAPGSDLDSFAKAGNLIVTPSHWSRDRLIDFGFPAEITHVIPHSASPDYFFPLPAGTIAAQRQALGFQEHEIVLLNIGTAIWNKGIDILLLAFALARQKRKDLRLLFKDQRSTYGISGDDFIRNTLASAGLLSDDVLQAITLIPANLTLDQMNAMYAIADCYVSPYRAEGFNLPACEAIACGTPVIVTAGGATDDFANGPNCQKIASTRHEHVVIQERPVSAYCEPSLEDLIAKLGTIGRKQTAQPAPANTEGWKAPVRSLIDLLRQ